MLNKSIPFLLAVIILAGGWSSCKDDPTAPSPNTQDTTKRTLTISFDSLLASVDKTVIFTVKATPGPIPKPYKIRWTIDTSHLDRLSVDTVSFIFKRGGSYSVNAIYIDSTGSHRDSVLNSMIIFDPNDTTSHAFTWSEFTNVGSETNMTGCWVFGPNCIYANNGSMHKFNGSTWETLSMHATDGGMIDGGLSGFTMFAFDTSDFWLVDADIIFHYIGNGMAQKIREDKVIPGYPTWLHSAWGTSSKNMYFVGDSGTILHFDGSNWSKMPTSTRENIYSISGTDNNNIWAAGYNTDNGHTILLHYTNGTWSVDPFSNTPTPITGGVGSVRAFDSAGHKVTFASASFVFRRIDDGPWTNVDSGKIPNQYAGFIGIGVLGNSPNDLFAIGAWGLAIHWNGRSWKRYDNLFEPNNSLYITGGASFVDNTVCIVGIKNGTSWVAIGQRK